MKEPLNKNKFINLKLAEDKIISFPIETFSINKIGTSYTLGKAFTPIIPYQDFKKESRTFKTIVDREVELILFNKKINQAQKRLEIRMLTDCGELTRKTKSHRYIKASDYLRYTIASRTIFNIDFNSKFIYRLLDLLRGDVSEILTSTTQEGKNGLLFLDKCTTQDKRTFNFIKDYIKAQDPYRNKTINTDTKEMYKEFNKSFKKSNETDDFGITYEQTQQIKYSEELQENDFFLYIIFCVIYFNQQLYLAYGVENGTVYARILDEGHLGHYMKIGLFIVDISNIIINSLNYLYKDTSLFEIWQENKGKEEDKIQDWNKFIHNIQEDSKNKRKVVVHAIIEHEMPTFATSEWVETDPKKFHEIEESIGDNGEITKVKRKGKASTLRAKKSYVYGKKRLENKSE